MYPSTSTQQPAAICALKSPADAIHILEAVRLGLVPRVTRRLTGHERSMIRPGTVWVWEEEETNMRRWTDGRRWGASRVGGGGFLVYTELVEADPHPASTDVRSSDNLSPPPSRGSGGQAEFTPRPHNGGHPYAPYGRSALKPESLIKQTYSTTMTHPSTGKAKKFHVVAYSSKHNPQGDANNPLPLPQQLPLLASIKITPGIWPEWEHRRDPESASRRATSFTPGHAQSNPMTATASPDVDAARGRSLQHDAYTARASPSQNQVRYPQPYTPPTQPGSTDRDMYGRPLMHAAPYSVPPGQERYNPYLDPTRSRPYAQPSSAASSSSTLPIPAPATPQDGFFDDRRYPSQAYAYDQYGRTYPKREPFYDEMPTSNSATYYDGMNRYQEDKFRSDGYTHDRHQSAPSHLMPPQDASGGKSPKMSVDSNLLNSGVSIAPGQPMSAPTTTPGGLTLPPLRLAIDERTPQGQTYAPAPTPQTPGNSAPYSGYQSQQMKMPSPEDNGLGKDGRQLGELGKRVK